MAKKKNTNKPGGSSKKGGTGGGRPGGGTFSQFSSTNEASAEHALTHGLLSGKKAAKKELKGGISDVKKDYGKAMDTVKAGYGTGRSDITSGAGKQVGAIDTGLGKSTGAITSGATAARGDIGTGYDAARGNITSGYGAGRSDTLAGLGASTGAVTSARDTALAGYAPYSAAGTAANNLYMGALGTDPTGHQAAVDAFQTAPGYEFEMNQGLDALDRRAASRGMLGSGNTSLDSLTFSQGLANQEWGGWLDRLAGQQAMGVDVAGKTGAINTGAGTELANLYTGAGTALTGLDTGEAGALSGLNTAESGLLSGIDTGEGAALSGLYTGAAGDLSGIYGSEATNLANLATGEADKTAGLYTDLSTAKNDYAKTMADLAYKTKTGISQAQAGYQLSRDKTGGNVLSGIVGAANTGINAFSPIKPQGQTLA